MSMQTQHAYDEGREAFARHIPLAQCPYFGMSTYHDKQKAWEQGWIAAEKDWLAAHGYSLDLASRPDVAVSGAGHGIMYAKPAL